MRAQNLFHDAIQSFVSGGSRGRVDLVLNCLGIRKRQVGQARVLIHEYGVLSKRLGGAISSAATIQVDPYRGDNRYVAAVSEVLSVVQDHIMLACVHGSLGFGDERAYSDFDGLVIFRHSAFQDVETLLSVSSVLQKAQKHMYEHDALQHHGWFVLTELDLRNYCEAYFPVSLFRHAKSILGGHAAEIEVIVRDSAVELNDAAFDLIESVRREDLEAVASSLYSLKSFMSRVMLLPAVYIQARTGKGIFKKDSFEAIGNYLDDKLLFPLERVSKARLEWQQDLKTIDRLLLTRNTSCRALASKIRKVDPGGQGEFVLDPTFQRGLKSLTDRMRQDLSVFDALKQ